MNVNNVSFGRRYMVFLMVFLGMLSAFGPFVTDMYLPVLPRMSEIFGCSASNVQMGLTMSLVGLAIGQLFFGPLSDKYGRRPVLVASLVLFSVSTVVILFSPDITWFNICRLFQGIGGSGGIVLSRSVATDYYSGRELAKTLAIIGAINGIAPVASPVVGGIVASFTGWQGIFSILLGIGIVLIAMSLIFRESHPQEHRNPAGLLSSFGAFGRLLCMPYFRVYVLMYAFANGILFAYISSASFVIQSHYGFSPFVFSICFAVNSIFIGIGSGLSVRIKDPARSALAGCVMLVMGSVAELVLFNICDTFLIYECLTLVILTGLGFVFTTSTTLTMTEGRQYIGASSAIFGAAGFLFGGIVSPIVGIGDILHSSMTVTLVCSIIVTSFTVMATRRKKEA
ncbi:MAG: multidrug effflux MFS transporter [Paenibacillus sp.]|nr:multidrug effflux MFS transporter [Paenibacillus sp.]